MRIHSTALFLVTCAIAVSADAVTVDSVVAVVRSSIVKKHKDAAIADSLASMKLAQRLDDRVVEILESEGAGPQTLGALQRMRDQSRLLPAPPDPPPGMTPPPPPSSTEEQQVWRQATGRSLDYNRSLPDFLCTETIHRWMDPTMREAWQAAPTVVADLTYFERKENYKVVTVDGKKSDKPMSEVGGAVTQGEFGSILQVIFYPGSQTEYRWDHWTTLRKRPTSVYFFRVGVAHHPHELRFRNSPTDVTSAFVGLHGYLYIEPETGSVLRISAISEDIPPAFPVKSARTVLDYEYAQVGDTRYLLPLRAEIRIDAANLQNLNSVEFQKYRKFRAEATVSFGK